MRKGWSLDARKWAIARQILTSNTWRHCGLKQTNKDLIPQESGIYLICARAVAGQDPCLPPLYDAIYVGLSRRLRKRFIDHCGGYGDVPEALQAFGRLDFYFTLLPADQIASAESRMIDAIGPSANKIQGTVGARIGAPEPLAGRYRRNGE